MSEIQDVKPIQHNDSNLNSHYSKNTKIKVPKNTVASAPETIPKVHLFNDFDANERLSAIDKDIFESTQRVAKPHKKKKKFLDLF